jgi:hypothetical protein
MFNSTSMVALAYNEQGQATFTKEKKMLKRYDITGVHGRGLRNGLKNR